MCRQGILDDTYVTVSVVVSVVMVAVVAKNLTTMHSDSPMLVGNTPMIRNWVVGRAHSIAMRYWVGAVAGYYMVDTVVHTVWVFGMDKDRWCFPGVGTWP